MTGIIGLAEEQQYEREFYKKTIGDTWKSFLEVIGLIHKLHKKYDWNSPLLVKAGYRKHVFHSPYLGIPQPKDVERDIIGDEYIPGKAPQIKSRKPEFFHIGCAFAEASYNFTNDSEGRKILHLNCMLPTDLEQKKSIEQLINETFPVDALDDM